MNERVLIGQVKPKVENKPIETNSRQLTGLQLSKVKYLPCPGLTYQSQYTGSPSQGVKGCRIGHPFQSILFRGQKLKSICSILSLWNKVEGKLAWTPWINCEIKRSKCTVQYTGSLFQALFTLRWPPTYFPRASFQKNPEKSHVQKPLKIINHLGNHLCFSMLKFSFWVMFCFF